MIQPVESTGSSQPLALFLITVLLHCSSAGHLARGRNSCLLSLIVGERWVAGGDKIHDEAYQSGLCAWAYTCMRALRPYRWSWGLRCATLPPAPLHLLWLPLGPATSGVHNAVSLLQVPVALDLICVPSSPP